MSDSQRLDSMDVQYAYRYFDFENTYPLFDLQDENPFFKKELEVDNSVDQSKEQKNTSYLNGYRDAMDEINQETLQTDYSDLVNTMYKLKDK